MSPVGTNPVTKRVTSSITRHPLIWGVGWSVVFGAALVVAVSLDWHGLIDWLLIGLLVLPSTIATVLVLAATPRTHFEEMSSVFSHFFVRYLALVFGLTAWGLSVVVGAAISQSIQLGAEGKEDEIIGIGLDLMLVVVPVVAALLWAAFVLRCAWFLVRVRGWAEVPTADRVPPHLFERRPALRRVVVGLAHPVLFAVTGLVVAIAGPSGAGTLEITF
ncbi:hypothetical protein ATC03_13715 [Agromyces aureus]|uniref:Uncharacterized protein n=1 Tax=Agromyces aureus TaxID=453304 RepID=A0A191WH69_9MICO|nr:hypothetical protein ATC03_13715 [Agromyces aureus]